MMIIWLLVFSTRPIRVAPSMSESISDLQFWDNDVAKLYGLKGIPQNFLIDPHGKIAATNLRGDDLEKKLEEIFYK